MTSEQLHLAYYRGGGPSKPYRCRKCSRATFAVSDERREHELSHKGPASDAAVDAYRAALREKVRP